MAETRNIMILGASYAGLGAAHYVLKHVHPYLPSSTGVRYQVVIIDPSDKLFLRHASPRATASEELVPNDKLFLDIEAGLRQYGDKVRFVHGKAVSWNLEQRSVSVNKVGRGETQILYHALVLATGTKTYSPLFSQQGSGPEEKFDALSKIHTESETARSIVIAGWFSSRPSHPKASITLITNATKLLPQLRESIAKQAEVYLNRVGVEVRYETKVSSATSQADGKTRVMLHNGEELYTDIYIPGMGVVPHSDYIPQHLKDEKGYVKQDAKTLRVDAAGAKVYAVGDIGTASRNVIPDILYEVPVLATNLKRDLLASPSNANAKPRGNDRVFEPILAEMQFVPIGRSKDVGATFGWRMPSWFVWLIKGRDYVVSGAFKDFVEGHKWDKESGWKGE